MNAVPTSAFGQTVEELLIREPLPSERRADRVALIVQWAAGIFILLTAIWVPILIHIVHMPEQVMANLISILACIAAIFLARRGNVELACHIVVLTVIAYIFTSAIRVRSFDPGSGMVHYWLFVIVAATQLVFLEGQRKWWFIYGALCLLLYVLVESNALEIHLAKPWPDDVAKLVRGITLASCMLTIIALTRVFVSDIDTAERTLERANDRMEQLLAYILPTQIASRLQREGKTFADGFEECSVLFADIVGFTSMCEQAPAEEVIHLLNDVFGRFDLLTDSHCVEKIKTIGDAYMVAAGIPDTSDRHAGALVELALDMLGVAAEYPDIAIRVGINTGPVVAGVIGRKRFIYDIWGDTVNVAARMQSTADPGTVQISEATASKLGNEFTLTPRGEIAIKGRGMLAAYVVSGRRQ